MINRAIIIGFGEVGRAHWDILSKVYPGRIFYKDKGPEIYGTDGKEIVLNGPIDLMMVATQCEPDNMGPFYEMIREYNGNVFRPRHIDILTTTPCGACDKIQEIVGNHISVTKSTIRGMHPRLDKFLLDIPKHIGGPYANELKEYYESAGIPCITHAKSRATELFHALNNSDYGIATIKAQENYDLCRHYGVDYMEYLKYKQSNNDGFLKAGYPSKVSPILTPPNGSIGGHCVVYSATTFPKESRGPLMSILADYNNKFNAPIKSDKN